MAANRYTFAEFTLDPADRRLVHGDAPVELNSRYLDALALLVTEQGQLVSKDRFLEEVWRGVPVTDEALTQCIRTLRKQLGDDAARPRFIETVPKHGYRFIAPVQIGEPGRPSAAVPGVGTASWRAILPIGAAGTLGGGVAGLAGGLFYGFATALHPLQPSAGALSIVLVILCLTLLVAVIGAAGVAFGIAVTSLARGRGWIVAGGAAGGLVVGAIVKLIGLDAFNLLLGHSPGDITGPLEGLVLGAATGIAAVLGARIRSLRRAAAVAAVAGGLAGLLIALLGGRLMGGSLDLLAQTFPGSRLRLDAIGALVGERGFGAISEAVTACLEGALFAGCVVGAMTFARRKLAR